MADFYASYPVEGGGSVVAGNLTDVGTDGIVIGNGTGAVIGSGTTIAQHVADTTHNGYLSSTDWNTFNGKQATVTIGALDAQAENANGLALVTNVLSSQSADATHPGMVNITTQTFAGNKTFSGTIAASNFSGTSSGTNTGDVTITAAGSSPNANGGSLTGQALTLQPANTSFPGVLLAADWNTFNGKQTATLTNTHILVGNGSNVATDVAMSGDISITNTGATAYNGTVPLNKGGTGQTTKAPAFDALQPMSAAGDLILGGASGTGTRLVIGSNTFVLTSNGTTAAWAANAAAATATPSVTGLVTSFTPTCKSSLLTTTNANYVILDTDGYDKLFFSTGSSNRTTTLPNPANNTGREIRFKKTDSGVGLLTIGPFAAETIEGFATFILSFQYQEVTLACDGTNWFMTSYPNKFYYNHNDDGQAASNDQSEASFFSTVVPYTAIYRVTCTTVFFSAATANGEINGVLYIKTGSATYGSAVYKVSGNTVQQATNATFSDRAIGMAVADWTGQVSGGDTVHMGLSANTVHGAAGGNSQHFLNIEEIRRV